MMRRFILAALALAALAQPADARMASDHVRIVRDHRRIVTLRHQVKELQAQIAGAGVTLKHAWPSLTDDEKTALAAVLKTLPKSMNFDIECNDGACTDLAYDIDDALEAAGLYSAGLDHSLGPLPYGAYVQVNPFDQNTAEQAIAALKKATGGRLAPTLIIAKQGQNLAGVVTIILGKYRAH